MGGSDDRPFVSCVLNLPFTCLILFASAPELSPCSYFFFRKYHCHLSRGESRSLRFVPSLFPSQPTCFGNSFVFFFSLALRSLRARDSLLLLLL
jgi:hypothetical protein